MKRPHTSDQIDAMSKLPEELLLDIMRLSSIKARAAVQTCTLSRRWNHLWEFLPDLDFDYREFSSGEPKQDRTRFSCFVTTMLQRRKTDTLDRFRLSCVNLYEKQYCSTIKKWIMYAIQHHVRVLELAVCTHSVRTVCSQNLFHSDSIEELHLHLSYCYNSSNYFMSAQRINLPRLRKLQLRGQRLGTGGDFFTKFISGFPLLEELSLESFDLQSGSAICSQNLQHLSFKNCGEPSGLIIKAPSLVSLRFFGSIYFLKQLLQQCGSISSLTIGHVYVPPYFVGLVYILKDALINKLPRVGNLELCIPKIRPISESLTYYRKIYNLKKLSLCGNTFETFSCMWKYLPNLEKLTLWPTCQHSRKHYHEILQNPKWKDALRGALMDCKKLKVVEVAFATYDDHKRKLVDDLRQLGDVEIVVSNRGF